MTHWLALGLAAALALLPRIQAASSHPHAARNGGPCTSFGLEQSRVAPVSLVGADFFDAGDLVNITNLFSSINTTTLPAFCREFALRDPDRRESDRLMIVDPQASSSLSCRMRRREAW
jgi:hypothetical protein